MCIAEKTNVAGRIRKKISVDTMYVGQKYLKGRWIKFLKKWGKNWESAGVSGGLKNKKI